MKISDLVAMCVRNLFRRKFRTVLTIMGVVIGTCAIVVTISLGIGINASQEAFLSDFGDLTVVEVYPRGGDDVLLNDEALAVFNAMPSVEAVTPFMNYYPQGANSPQIYQGKKERYTNWAGITGITPEALEALGYKLAEGTMPEAGGKKIQLLFGSVAAYEFYNTKNGNFVEYYGLPEDQMPDPYFDPFTADFHISIEYYENNKAQSMKWDAEVVGILSADVSDYESKYNVYMDIQDLKMIQAEYEKARNIKKDKDSKEEYNLVKVKAHDIKEVGELATTLDAMGFGTWTMNTWRESMEEQTQQIQMILGMLGAVSLFVAAISITNTMIMSVYERTREIGVMKVLGCLVRDVRSIFLIEAGLIGFFGGILGIGTSYLLSHLLNTFGSDLGSALGGFAMEGSKVSIIPSWLALIGLVFATCIGIISGFTPANRAVKISALEAIKTE